MGAFQHAGFARFLDGEREVNVFAPTNAAFEATGNLVAGMMAADLQAVVGYQFVPGVVLYGGLLAGRETHARRRAGR